MARHRFKLSGANKPYIVCQKLCKIETDALWDLPLSCPLCVGVYVILLYDSNK